MENKNLASGKPQLIRRRCLRSHHAGSKCELCIHVCEKDALFLLNGAVAFHPLKCTGCGACINICPTEALISSDPSSDLVPGIVKSRAEEGAISFACSLTKTRKGANIPCLQQLDVTVYLNAAAEGAKEIKLLNGGCKTCPRYNEHESVFKEHDESQGIFDKTDKAQIVLKEKEPEVNLGRRMLFGRAFQDTAEIAKTGEQTFDKEGFKDEPWKRVPEKRKRELNFLSKNQDAPKEVMETLHSVRPYIDEKRCTACTLCVSACPTGSLKVKKEGEEFVFTDLVRDCIGCGLCTEVCYVNAIKLVPENDVAKVLSDEPIFLLKKKQSDDLFNSTLESKTREIFKGFPVYKT
ncbi:MAG: 4Fe-4S binding protein [Burkholderiales bacterium]|nr:4Fe-4S binding protein [Burkholderiales bacterium]